MLEKILSYDLINYHSIHITTESVLKLIIVWLVTKLILILIKKGFKISGKKRSLEPEEWMTFYIIIKYFVWLIGLTVMLNIIGVNVTMLVAGSSALLIGLGIGIQQYLYDMFAGLVILFEKKITIGTVIELEDKRVAKITNVKMRFSEAVDRDDVRIIIPNSKFLSNRINYWEHNKTKSRFTLDVGVAYGSDPEKVSELISEAAKSHKNCGKTPEPIVRLVSFGDSSLNFQLLFWSKNKFRINQVKSDINKEILRLFNENNIQIPFPQRDIHIIREIKK